MNPGILQALLDLATDTSGRQSAPQSVATILNPWRKQERPTPVDTDAQTLQVLKALLQKYQMQVLLGNTEEAVSGTLRNQGVPGNGNQPSGGAFGSS